MAIPPGIIFILSVLPFLLVPPTLTYGVLRIINVSTPTPPSTFYKEHTDKQKAASLNAHLIPRVPRDSFDFFGYKLTKGLVKNAKMNYISEAFRLWAKEYGPVFQIELLADTRIFTTEPDHIKALLATQFDTFHKGPALFKQLQSLLGEGVFNSDGDLWKFHRSMARPYFNRERIADFDNFEQHATLALAKAEKRLAEGYAIDFQDLVARFTLDSATQFLFGYDVESLAARIPYPSSPPLPHLDKLNQLNTPELVSEDHPSNAFVDAFAEGQEKSVRRMRVGDIWPVSGEDFWRDGVQPLRKVVEKYIEPMVVKALERKKRAGDQKETGDGELGDTLLEDLIQQTQDVTMLKDELINLLVAGRDTTASTLTFCLYMLAEHPTIEARLRREVLEAVGPNRQPTADDFRGMKFMRAFINEVLRLYPAVPNNNRTATQPAVWTSKNPGSKPYYVPAGVRIMYSVFLMQRRTDLWGPDALEFDPDRFLDDRVQKYLTPNPYIFLPFNAGPRICLGQQFAYQEMSFFLVKLMQRFENFKLAPDAQPANSKPPAHWAQGDARQAKEKIWPQSSLTMSVKGGLWVTMDPVKQ
ncbi:cytochrome P450 monooxygenase pc-3 [Crepidotus variabilis]|uniref:Cytochrome P450 monooxygenase pc-3 n=1 Tax=Crepidotus variabilis TaxID=179855 RepID=A0A9P6E681_9AGAR|nr:cytochrome P450 monooxygenase pc-3 [Crepidotus variabilis]